MLRTFLLVLTLLGATAHAQIPEGATKQEVINLIGGPASTSKAGDREILNYPDFTVVLEQNQMTKFQFKSGKHKPLSNYLVSPPKAVPATTGTGQNSPQNSRTGSIPKSETPRSISPTPAPPQSSSASVVKQKPSSIPPLRPTLFPAFTRGQITLAVIVFVGLIILSLISGKSRRKPRRDVDDLFPQPASKARSHPSPPIIPPRATPAKPDPLKNGWSLALLREIEWHRFEQVVASYERELGHDAELTDFGPDGGIDVLVFEKENCVPKRVIQCKAHVAQIGVDPVRSFLGAAAVQKIPLKAFYTTSTFTEHALAEFKDAENVELVDGPTFLNRIQRLQLSAQLRLFDIATEGDYRTPTCANCGVKMVLRTASKGRNEGEDFYGCRNFPRCQQTFKLKRSS